MSFDKFIANCKRDKKISRNSENLVFFFSKNENLRVLTLVVSDSMLIIEKLTLYMKRSIFGLVGGNVTFKTKPRL